MKLIFDLESFELHKPINCHPPPPFNIKYSTFKISTEFTLGAFRWVNFQRKTISRIRHHCICHESQNKYQCFSNLSLYKQCFFGNKKGSQKIDISKSTQHPIKRNKKVLNGSIFFMFLFELYSMI